MHTLQAIIGGNGHIDQEPGSGAVIARHLADYCRGDHDALYNLGVAYSTGSNGVACDLIEAHRWLNIAAANGHEEAALCRTDIAEEMTAREIAEAQRRAREWLRHSHRRAA